MAACHGGKNGLERARAESPLRLLLPKVAGARAAWACVTSLGGGLVRGDALALEVEVKEEATLLLTTQASTKAFRGHTRQTWTARVDGTLVAWPDPVSCFAGATYESEIHVTLGPRG
ncbi:MAG TPA: urease accessory protein UreD, partial [Polyangiaceae bacterium]|nr:urease accessory protein UreD [Polyangiaceae bacterium]